MPQPIPVIGTIVCTLNVEQSLEVQDLDVGVTLTHSWVRDLRISLERDSTIIDTVITDIDSTFNEVDSVWVHGDTTYSYDTLTQVNRVMLLQRFPADSAVNMTNCWFDQDAGITIYQGIPPFTGSYRPIDGSSSLNRFDGQDVQGVWRLRIQDEFMGDSGELLDFRLEVNGIPLARGLVTNAISGDSLSGASVLAVEQTTLDTLGSALTGTRGKYELKRVPTGTYQLVFSASNFDTVFVNDVVLTEGLTAVVDAELIPRVTFSDYPYAGEPMEIPDGPGGQAQIVINVPDETTVLDADITINITHTYIADLVITLENPGGTRDTLFNPPGDDIGDNMINCRFDDEASASVNDGVGPFTGRYRPVRPLSIFDDRQAQGDWTLYVEDYFELDTGTLLNATLHFEFPLAADESVAGLPESFLLHPAYPNPFNPTANVVLDVARTQEIALQVFDITGRLTATLFEGRIDAGTHHFYWQPYSQSSGVYFLRAATKDHTQTQKLVLLK